MRIKGPGGTETPRTEGVADVGAAAPASPSAPAASAGGTARAERAASVGGAAPAAGLPELVAEVAGRLRAGDLSPRDAVELLIDDAIDRQVGRATADRAALAAELKDLLRRYTESDPYLASKVRRLGQKP